MRRLLFSIFLCCAAIVGMYAQNVEVTDIVLEREGQLGYKVLDIYNSFDEVRGLRISGPIGDEDWRTLKEMKYLEELYMTDAVTYSMPDRQFYYYETYNSLRIVELPLTLEKIGDNAFQYCWNMRSVTFPNVKSIGNYAFWNCCI